jgi:hypothetical protein
MPHTPSARRTNPRSEVWTADVGRSEELSSLCSAAGILPFAIALLSPASLYRIQCPRLLAFVASSAVVLRSLHAPLDSGAFSPSWTRWPLETGDPHCCLCLLCLLRVFVLSVCVAVVVWGGLRLKREPRRKAKAKDRLATLLNGI